MLDRSLCGKFSKLADWVIGGGWIESVTVNESGRWGQLEAGVGMEGRCLVR